MRWSATVVLLLTGCPGLDDILDTDGDALCADRTGGALVTLEVAEEESFTAWVTDGPFIDTAQAHLDAGTTQVPVFGEVLDGTDCDEQWSWHVDPADASWADVTIELCDARPSYIEENLDAWQAEVGQWCPWSAVVTEVDDRR